MRRDYTLLKQHMPIRQMFVGDPPELNTAAVALVRAQGLLPELDEKGSVFLDTGINGARPIEKGFRNTIHFALNHHVSQNDGGDWTGQPYVIIAGLEETQQLVEKRMKDSGLAERTINGVHLGALHPLDTWYCLGYEAKLELPNAAVIAPENNSPNANHLWPVLDKNELFKRKGNRITYKSTNFTTTDFLKLLEKSKDFVGLLSFNGIKQESVEKIKTLAQQAPDFKLNTTLRQGGHDSKTIQTINNIMSFQTKNLATIHTLQAKNYPQMTPSGHTWDGIDFGSPKAKAIESAAQKAGARYGAARYHSATGYSHLEDAINDLMKDTPSDKPAPLNKLVPLEEWQHGKEKTHREHIEAAINNPEIDETTRATALLFLKDRYGIRCKWEEGNNGCYNAKLVAPPTPSPKHTNPSSKQRQATPAQRLKSPHI